MEKAYKFRLYPTLEQEELIQKTFGCCRFVFNYFLAKRIETYHSAGTSMSFYTCSADLTALKRTLEWLYEVDSSALKNALRDLDTAYRNFFRRVKRGQNPGFPQFKSKRRHKKSYRSQNSGHSIYLGDNYIKLPKLGLVRAALSRQVEGRILSATVSQNPSGKYFVSLCCTDVEIPQYEGTVAKVGLDMGLKSFCVTSEGIAFANPKHLAKSQKKLTRLQRRLSRKSKGSRNRQKARITLAKCHEQITNRRNDGLHKLSASLVKNYDIICLEDLPIKNMVKNHRLAQSISDTSWGEFIRQLTYKCQWQHKVLVKIDRFFPSSQLCSQCGYQNKATKDLRLRNWTCPQCGAIHDRDVNAARNILKEGLRLLHN